MTNMRYDGDGIAFTIHPQPGVDKMPQKKSLLPDCFWSNLFLTALFYLLDYYEVTYNCNWPWSTDCQGRPVLTGFI